MGRILKVRAVLTPKIIIRPLNPDIYLTLANILLYFKQTPLRKHLKNANLATPVDKKDANALVAFEKTRLRFFINESALICRMGSL